MARPMRAGINQLRFRSGLRFLKINLYIDLQMRYIYNEVSSMENSWRDGYETDQAHCCL